MLPISYARHQFPPVVIQHAVWLYLRFTLSYRDVEDLLAERGVDLSYETIRRWVLKFGPAFAQRLRRGRPRPGSRWHLNEMVVRIGGEPMYLWRAGPPTIFAKMYELVMERHLNRMDLLIFDFDGVIADTEIISNTVLAEAITALGHPTSVDDAPTLYMGKR